MDETTAPIEDADGNRLCIWCGGPIVQPETGRKRDYCSRSHREYAYRERTVRRRIGDALGLRSGGQETT
jgi:hypothetical protein